jgi:aryl-alcohol dehydrogenase-like predicted oxidoreductase
MRYKLLGNSGLRVSELALGTMTFADKPLCQGTGEQAPERAGVGAAMIVGIGAGVFNEYYDVTKIGFRF